MGAHRASGNRLDNAREEKVLNIFMFSRPPVINLLDITTS
jgi:hypothetical protein